MFCVLQQPSGHQVSLFTIWLSSLSLCCRDDGVSVSSPVKACHFESHLNKLQADSNYLLSEEFEVTGSDITTLYNLLCLKHKSFVTFLSGFLCRIWKMSAATRRWTLPACRRTEERTATTTSCHVRAAVCYIHSNLLQFTQRRTNQCKNLCQTSLRPLIKETATVSADTATATGTLTVEQPIFC